MRYHQKIIVKAIFGLCIVGGIITAIVLSTTQDSSKPTAAPTTAAPTTAAPKQIFTTLMTSTLPAGCSACTNTTPCLMANGTCWGGSKEQCDGQSWTWCGDSGGGTVTTCPLGKY